MSNCRKVKKVVKLGIGNDVVDKLSVLSWEYIYSEAGVGAVEILRVIVRVGGLLC